MENKLSELMDFPTSITRPVSSDQDSSSSSTTTMSLIYILRGVVVDPQLTYFSQWGPYTHPYKKKLGWFKSDFSDKPEITSVDEGEVLTIARDRGRQGVLLVYVREDVPEVVNK